MKIVYVISNINSLSKGGGGHYYSLLSTVSALKNYYDIRIINIGSHESIAFKDSRIDVINIINRSLNNIKLLYNLYKYIKYYQPDILHAFDEFAYFYSRFVSLIFKIPIILTKCGGPNPKYFYPYCKNLIVYSKENFEYFNKQNKYSESNILFIPNRIFILHNDNNRINELMEKYQLSNYKFVFLRIARIGSAYRNSIVELINIVDLCNKNYQRSCLLLLGIIEDSSVFEEIKSHNSKYVFVETDDYYTKSANEVIEVADVVMGTGRSFMEAALKNKLMLAPINCGRNLVMVDNNNFEKLFITNFSGREKIENFDQELEIDKLIKILKSPIEKQKLIETNKKLFNDNFNMEFALDNYNKLYKSIRFKYSFKIYDTFKNYFFMILMFRACKLKNKKSQKK